MTPSSPSTGELIEIVTLESLSIILAVELFEELTVPKEGEEIVATTDSLFSIATSSITGTITTEEFAPSGIEKVVMSV